LIVVKEPNHTIIELNDTERAFLVIILEQWAAEPSPSEILDDFAASLAQDLEP